MSPFGKKVMLTTRLLGFALALVAPWLAHATAEADFYFSGGLTTRSLLAHTLGHASSDGARSDPFPAGGLGHLLAQQLVVAVSA